MTKVQICKKDGTPTHYFWSEQEGVADRTRLTVYKQTPAGVKRMKGVQFDALQNKMLRP